MSLSFNLAIFHATTYTSTLGRAEADRTGQGSLAGCMHTRTVLLSPFARHVLNVASTIPISPPSPKAQVPHVAAERPTEGGLWHIARSQLFRETVDS